MFIYVVRDIKAFYVNGATFTINMVLKQLFKHFQNYCKIRLHLNKLTGSLRIAENLRLVLQNFLGFPC